MPFSQKECKHTFKHLSHCMIVNHQYNQCSVKFCNVNMWERTFPPPGKDLKYYITIVLYAVLVSKVKTKKTIGNI